MKILVAEDDAMTRLALSKNLEKWGYEVVAVEDGTLALESHCRRSAADKS